MKVLVIVLALLAPIEQLDWAVQHRVQQWRNPVMDRVMKAVTDLGRPTTTLGVLLGIAAFGGPAGAATARLAILTLAPTNLVVEVTKRAVGRTRPDGDRKRSNSALPSSHAANAFAVAAVFARRWRRAGPVLWIFAALVAYSRMHLNRHFLSDVVVGAAIGVFFTWLAVKIADRYGWGMPANQQ